jgi:hypothetical protein
VVRVDAVRVLHAVPGVLRAGPWQRLRRAGDSGPGGPLVGDDRGERQYRAFAEVAAGRRAGTGGPQAVDVRRQPAGRLPAGRALQRLRPGHPVARRPVPGDDHRRHDHRYHGHRRWGPDARVGGTEGHRGARAKPVRLRGQPAGEVLRPGTGAAGAARGGGVPALHRPAARLAGHHAEPGADRPAAGPLPGPARDRRGRRVLAARPSGPAERGSGATRGAGADPAGRAAPGAGDRRRLPDRGRVRPAGARLPAAPDRPVGVR